MRKLFSIIVAAIMLLCAGITASADPEPETPVEPGIIEEYQYTNYIRSLLSIQNDTAYCKSVVMGFPDIATKIEITQTLYQVFGPYEYYVHSWSHTYYDWYASFQNTRSSLGGGTYRVKTVAKVYSGSNYETVSLYSNNVTC